MNRMWNGTMGAYRRKSNFKPMKLLWKLQKEDPIDIHCRNEEIMGICRLVLFFFY
jgi:hypothetical protein